MESDLLPADRTTGTLRIGEITAQRWGCSRALPSVRTRTGCSELIVWHGRELARYCKKRH